MAGVLTLGGKGSSLSSASVFEFVPLSQVNIDPSAFSSNSKSKSKSQKNNCNSSSSSNGNNQFQFSIPNYLTPEEIRASLLVLLNKLLLAFAAGSSSSLTASAASKLSHALNNSNINNSDINGITIDGVTEEEAKLLNSYWPDAAVVGIFALLDYTSSALSTVADAVASLSCEALGVDVSSAFNVLADSGDGLSDQDAISVANNFKVLLNGSKLPGKLDCDLVSDIPKVHGRLRSFSRLVHSTTRVELNSRMSSGTGNDLVKVLWSLALSHRDLGKCSWGRANLLVNDSLFPVLTERFKEGCPGIGTLDDLLNALGASYLENDFIKSAHKIYILSDTVRKILSWEATTSFVLLEGIELIEKCLASKPVREDTIGENAKTVTKRDKRKKVMGKGTTILMQFIKDGLLSKTTEVVDSSVLLEELLQYFLSLLDLKDPGFACLLEKVKEIVDSNESRRLPKLPKGTRDFANEQMAVREKAFSIITEVFKRHGAMALDTPDFELRETLTGKYGEDSKLIYDLADQGGELCSLRYDLTVPFARYVAMNGLASFRRYQIGKVHRRDNPSKGRYREFYQCDFDIAGDGSLGADFEVIKILTELLDELNIGDYEIKLNHRKLLDAVLDICGVPSEKVRTICSSIDKLDKLSFDQVEKEMVDEKGLNAETVNKIRSFVTRRGRPSELLSELKQEVTLLENRASDDALKDLDILFKALENARCINKVVLDLSLARGLDYYTGVIYEAVFKGATQVGSIAAGGRYDNLIGKFGTKPIPAIGVSLGIERVFAIMENQEARATETQVLVSVLVDDLPSTTIPLAAKLVSECWGAKLKAEFMVTKRMEKHFKRAKDSKIPWMVIVRERDVNGGTVVLKDVVANKEHEVSASEFVEELGKQLNRQ